MTRETSRDRLKRLTEAACKESLGEVDSLELINELRRIKHRHHSLADSENKTDQEDSSLRVAG